MKKAKKPIKFYKIIGFCRSCKERFFVDMENRYASKNYCKKCTGKFRKGAGRYD